MSVIVKVMGGGKKTASYMEKGDVKFIELLPGRNKLADETWDKIKNSNFIKNKLKFDQMTFTLELYEDPKESTDAKVEEIDIEEAKSFVGMEDGKDLLYEYAQKFGYTLRRNMNIDNMLKDLEEKIEG